MSAPTPCEQLQQRGGWAEDAALKRCTFPIGPRNTWSNLAYAIVGWIVAAHVHFTNASLAFALAMTVLCLGSGWYHGVKTLWSNTLDWMGMYMVFASLTVHAIVPSSPAAPWIMLVFGGFIAVFFSNPLNHIDLDIQIGVFLFLSLLPGIFGPSPHPVLVAGTFALYLLSYGIQRLDEAHSPRTGLWGHAIWHGLSSVAIGLTFLSQSA